MKAQLKKILLESTGASRFQELEKIQDLWSGYGVIKRLALEGAAVPTVVIKHVCLPEGSWHPRGWNTSRSHERKVKSYQVETAWYRDWSAKCPPQSYVPKCYAIEALDGEVFFVFEDLNASGFSRRADSLTPKEMRVCLKWLAHFHSTFMNQDPKGLWQVGTYWHLETRPDELKKLKDSDLRAAAEKIDQTLNSTPFKTIVHGDAKLANFCFTEDLSRAAMVDFQYVGGGCGMKDVAYFIGSCLYEKECEAHEEELLEYYFSVFMNGLKAKHPELDARAVIEDWRKLFPYAWTDFHRFIKGWSPGHWKINDYSERIAREVLEKL